MNDANKNVMERIDAHAQNINAARKSGVSLAEAGEQFRRALETFEQDAVAVHAGDIECEALISLVSRVERLQELRRMMEIGALWIQAQRALDATWKRLP